MPKMRHAPKPCARRASTKRVPPMRSAVAAAPITIAAGDARSAHVSAIGHKLLASHGVKTATTRAGHPTWKARPQAPQWRPLTRIDT